MKIVIVGNGKVGHTLAEQLSREDHDIVLVDNNSKALKNTLDVLDVIGIQGNGASLSVQLEADVPKADILIAATSTDELNILSCMVAKKLGVKHSIARVRNPEYRDQLIFMKEELGLSMSINPEFAAAMEISRILRFPSAIKVEPFARGNVELVEIKLSLDNPLNGLPLSRLYHKYRVKVLICAVQRKDQVIIPTGDFVLQAGDKITIAAAAKEMEAFFKALGILKNKIRSVMMIGGGKISYYLARELSAMGMEVKIVENDEKRCQALSDLLPDASIICGDGTDEELLNEEGIADVDAFVALTGLDEENIILSMYAAAKNVDKVITKINKISFVEILENANIESVISPKLITANEIIRYVRAMQNSLGSNVETLHRIVDHRVEALEFRVRDNAKLIGIPLKDLELKDNLLIACIIRGNRVIIPGGGDEIHRGDSVVVVTMNQNFQDLNDIMR